MTQAARYERSKASQGYRSSNFYAELLGVAVALRIFACGPKSGHRRRENSVEEALIEMYLAGVSVRGVENITEALWGSKVSVSTISELSKKAYVNIEVWCNRPLRGGEYENVAVLVAIAVNKDGYREVLYGVSFKSRHFQMTTFDSPSWRRNSHETLLCHMAQKDSLSKNFQSAPVSGIIKETGVYLWSSGEKHKKGSGYRGFGGSCAPRSLTS